MSDKKIIKDITEDIKESLESTSIKILRETKDGEVRPEKALDAVNSEKGPRTIIGILDEKTLKENNVLNESHQIIIAAGSNYLRFTADQEVFFNKEKLGESSTIITLLDKIIRFSCSNIEKYKNFGTHEHVNYMIDLLEQSLQYYHDDEIKSNALKKLDEIKQLV
jgi:hypothetical protein